MIYKKMYWHFNLLIADLYKENMNIGGATESVIEQEKLGIDKTEDQVTYIFEKVDLPDIANVDTDKQDTNIQDIEQDIGGIDNTDDEVNSYQEINTNKVVTEVDIHVQPDVYRLVKEIDTYVQEEVISDITLPEVHKIDIAVDTAIQLDAVYNIFQRRNR